RVLKRIVPTNRSITRAVCLPASEQPTRYDSSNWFRINQIGIEVQRLICASSRHCQTLNVEFKRKLARLERVDYQFCPITDKFIYDNLDLLGTPRDVSHLRALFPRRQIQRQTFHVYGIHMHGRTKQIYD